MNTAIRSVVLGTTCLLCVSPAWTQDWPQWRGPDRDGVARGFKAPATWPEAITKKWSVSVGDGVATPALVGERLFVFARQDGDEVLRCLDAAAGKDVWQDKYAADGVGGPASGFSGPRLGVFREDCRGGIAPRADRLQSSGCLCQAHHRGGAAA